MADTSAHTGEIYYESYAKAPRSILMANDLSCQQKVILLQMLDRYDYLRNTGKIKDGDSFYMVGDAFEEQNNLTAQTIQRQIIPSLVDKGLVRKSKKGVGNNKTYTYYDINFDAIGKYNRCKPKEKPKPDFSTMPLDEQDQILRKVLNENDVLVRAVKIEGINAETRNYARLKVVLTKDVYMGQDWIDAAVKTLCESVK